MIATQQRSRSTLGGLGASLSYEAFFTDWLGAEVTLAGVPFLVGGTEGPTVSAEIRPDASGVVDRSFVRALAALRLGDNWLVQAGGAAPLTLDAALPWLSLAKRW